MIILLICIVLNAFIGITFKLFQQYKVELLPAIVINYFTCVIIGSVVYKEWVISIGVFSQSWLPYSVFLGLVFVVMFNIYGVTVKEYGVMIATIFQKMSLIAPALLGLLMYNEDHSINKIAGILLAIMAILLISHPDKKVGILWSLFWLPIATFIGSSIIELTLFYVDVENIVINGDIRFVSSIFFFAGCFGSILLIWKAINQKLVIRDKDLIAGICLGIPNFFSIYLILYLLSEGWEGSVLFPINNLGILSLASIAGIFFFKEKLDNLKAIGFIAALLSILLISI